MNHALHDSFAVQAVKRHLWMASLGVLSLLLPAQAQVPSVKPQQTEVAREISSSSSPRNIYRAGGNVRLTELVKGDFYAAGGRVTVDQSVEGDATLAGGAVTVRAAVGEDLRVAGGDINIESTVRGELYAYGGNITLSNAASISDAVTLYGGHINIEGKINGPLTVYAQKVVLNGEISRDVEINAQEIELGPRAKLRAALRYPGNAQFKTAEGAVIGGAITRGNAMNGRPDTHHDREWHGQMTGSGYGWAATVVGTLVSFIVLLATSALFLFVFSGFSHRASLRMLEAPWPALAAGMAVLLVTPMLAILLLITLIGIPLGIALMMLFPLMLLMGCVVGIFNISQRVQQAIQKETTSATTAARLSFFALTLMLVMLLGSVPFIGSLIFFAIMLMGTGACALELYNQARSGRKPPAPDASGSAASSGTIVDGIS